MPIEQESFVRYNEEKPVDSFTIRLNEEERELLNKCKVIIEQKKDSTAMKTLAFLGAKVLHEEKTAYLLAIIFKNKKNNKRIGLIDFD